MNFFLEENIYFSQTKDYIKEVVSSYISGNYRSALVMLYSIVFSDLLLKLRELSEIYNDTCAENIIKKVVDKKENGNNKSEWEIVLIEEIKQNTEILDNASLANLKHLKEYRNLCAHPQMDNEFKLYSPSKELCASLIKTTIEEVLQKPPIFIEKHFDNLLEDLESVKDIYINKYKDLSKFLNRKYFSRMTDTMKKQTFRSLWKICFKLNNQQSKENRLINVLALRILSENLNNKILKIVGEEEKYYLVEKEDTIVNAFVYYLSYFGEIYNVLCEDVKIIIDYYIERDFNLASICWFKFAKLGDHLSFLYEYLNKYNRTIGESYIRLVEEWYSNFSMKSKLIDFWIDYYGASDSYYEADDRYNNTIYHNIKLLTNEQVMKLVEVSNKNNQIYNNYNTKRRNTEIVYLHQEYFSDFDFSKFENFVYDKMEEEKE